MKDYLKDIHLINFKNFSDFKESFYRINCFVGKNGVGKTNILEAIHYLAFCKPYFSHNYEEESIKFGENFFAIHGNYGSDGGEVFTKFSCILKADEKKKFRANDTAYQRLSDHIGTIPLVVVSPADQILVSGGADFQRTFLNYTLSQCDREYLEALKDYNKALEMRNRLLKNAQIERVFDNTQLESVDYLLSLSGNKIRAKRQELCDKLRESIKVYHKLLSCESEDADLLYESIETDDLFSLLQMNLKRDLITGYTTAGVHKDRLNLTINEHKAKHFASQGQQKSLLLSLKLAQFDYVSDRKEGRKPILLLDDIFDKFDFERVCSLLNLLVGGENRTENSSFGQIFITDTHLNRVEEVFKRTADTMNNFSPEDVNIRLLN
ncbi:MAG: DNA replication and repair protein RecF [Bacteroidales bacterium]|jgi:DNA replication and repair protein RecF|nr:DNA replication and repair protein RecF [Bacteroidales bacterium]